MFNKGSALNVSATDQPVRPGDFALGSPQSRAAARFLVEARDEGGEKGMLIVLRLADAEMPPATKCTCQMPRAGQAKLCRCFIPENRRSGNASMCAVQTQPQKQSLP